MTTISRSAHLVVSASGRLVDIIIEGRTKITCMSKRTLRITIDVLQETGRIPADEAEALRREVLELKVPEEMTPGEMRLLGMQVPIRITLPKQPLLAS